MISFPSMLFIIALITTIPSPVISQKTYFAPLGACERVRLDEFRCTYQVSDCEAIHIEGTKNINGEKWWQPYYLDYDKDATTCSCDKNTVVGACLKTTGGTSEQSLEYRCAPNNHTCSEARGEVFVKQDVWKAPAGSWCGCDREWRTNVLGKEWEGGATLYGACWDDKTREGMCSLDPGDCETPHNRWIDAVEVRDLMGKDCTCSDVVVGACFGGSSGFECSVSADSCSRYGNFYTRKQVAEQHNNLKCRLCSPGVENKYIPKDMAGAPTASPSLESVDWWVDQKPQMTAEINESSPSDSNDSTKLIVIVGVGFSIGIVATLFLLSVYLVIRRGHRNRMVEKQQVQTMREEDNGVEIMVPKVT